MPSHINLLAPGRSERNSKNVIFSLVLLIGIFRSSHDNALWWMPQDLTDDKSTLVQVIAWCRQATSHYLGQGWLSSLSPYGVARPQWVNEYHLYSAHYQTRNLWQKLYLWGSDKKCICSHKCWSVLESIVKHNSAYHCFTSTIIDARHQSW